MTRKKLKKTFFTFSTFSRYQASSVGLFFLLPFKAHRFIFSSRESNSVSMGMRAIKVRAYTLHRVNVATVKYVCGIKSEDFT